MRIFHIATVADWEGAQRAGSYTTSTRGRTLAEEGFIHASREDQWRGVRERFYADVDEPLVLLTIDTDRLVSPVVEEAPGGGVDETFPHIYGPLNTDAVTSAVPIELSDLWICPRCGARLVSRNLFHSCGQFTLEDLFARADPSVLALARSYVEMLHRLGDVQVLPQRTRLVCVARVRFAGLYPRRDGFLASFALHRWLDSERIVKTADYGPRWRGHFVMVRAEADLDVELMAWLQESHDVVGLQRDLRPPAAADPDASSCCPPARRPRRPRPSSG